MVLRNKSIFSRRIDAHLKPQVPAGGARGDVIDNIARPALFRAAQGRGRWYADDGYMAIRDFKLVQVAGVGMPVQDQLGTVAAQQRFQCACIGKAFAPADRAGCGRMVD